ncbi:MAG: hypothetical protein HY700_07305 [Gemmatimonadetes bacterium]|nr:hypothetical protein [Gemmatimonadota bacterium]
MKYALRPRVKIGATAAVLSLAAFAAGVAQQPMSGSTGNNVPHFEPGGQGSRNIHLLAHVPLGRGFTTTDMEIEQELSRPYAYVSRMEGTTHSAGTSIINLKDPTRAYEMYYWRIHDPDVHHGMGAMDNKYFKLSGRYYDVQSLQFDAGGPDADLGAMVLDVTGLPDTSKIKEVGGIREPQFPGGFHNIYMYKHSDGRSLLFATLNTPKANIYDMAKVITNDPNQGLVGSIPIPQEQQSIRRGGGYHDFYVGYDPVSHQDRFYGAGVGGYYIYDVTAPDAPKLLTSITGVAGVTGGHTFTPDATGRYVVAETEYQYAPLRIFDLKPGLDGTVKNISRPIGAWTADWRNLVHNHEVRWPYVFVSGYEDGLQVFNMMDPSNPYTVGYYYTYDGPHNRGWGGVQTPEAGQNVMNGAFGVDVRNADGLIVISDFATGFWAFKMEGFDGWNGHQWGVPNVSSAQDWDNGPEGAPKPGKVS